MSSEPASAGKAAPMEPSFTRGLAFAVLAAVASVGWLWASGAILGLERACAFLALALIATYPMFQTQSLGAEAALFSLAAVIPIGVWSPEPITVAAAGPVILALARSGIAFRRTLREALILEIALGLAALATAWLLYGDSVVEASLAVWGFWLVQAGFPLAMAPARCLAAGVANAQRRRPPRKRTRVFTARSGQPNK